MASKKKTELATTDDATELALAEAANLAECMSFFDEMETDGMAEVGGEDIKIRSLIWNMGGVDKDKNAYPKNVFFDTLTEKTQSELDAIMLSIKKTNRWDDYNDITKKTDVICESIDQITGTMRDGGLQRPCLDCPDKRWFEGDDGKAVKRCGEVHTVVGIERLTQKPFIARFKKTGLRPWRNYLMAHHYGARVGGEGGRANIPLFAYVCTVTLENHESGIYAVPKFERSDAFLPRAELEQAYNAAVQYEAMIQELMGAADKTEAQHVESTNADNMSPDDFVG